MKRLLMLMAALMAVLMVVGTASAELLGIKGSYEGNRPDIEFNNTGVITYDADTNLFTLTATDEKLVLPDGTVYWLSGPGFTTTLSLQIYVDESGNLTGGVTGYDMVEKVTKGCFEIDGVTYSAGDVLLQAEVKAFGWGTGTGGVPAFDFLFDTISGGLVNQYLWPSPAPLTAAWVETGVATYSWDSDFTLDNAKGDKMVTPAPPTLLLLGSGLLGFGLLSRRRKGNT
ncbi:MAG TPA: PEP-CTERM sorting domain-containing protein [Candidatus Desulfofervidus auxilii]|uniref:PEP-CTERM sorting domain-containing protein n=1 Tax=Desulfofervidus auxilii TaxID=1621989 RepID=A0A7C1ZNR8_DESA2|nr:PEP-CTERM sorting domain-containing protein [Candidatus Desulfofervidus auxilii]